MARQDAKRASAQRRKAATRRAPAPPPAAEPPPAGQVTPALLGLTAAWLLLFARPLFRARLFTLGDASFLRAFAEFSSARWHAVHERTHWNPFIFMGLPATASLQDSRPQWLPGPLLDLFDALHRLPGFPPLAIPLLAHLAGMLATALLARALWRARTAAMIWAGLAWGLAPLLLVPFAFGQDSLLMAGALMPVVLLAVHHVAMATNVRTRLAAALGLSLATACSLLAAHPQMTLLTAPLAAAFAIERTNGRRRAALLEMLVAAGLGVAMSAALWWPAHLYTAHTVRGGETGGIGLADVSRWSASGLDLMAVIWPWAAGFGGASYFGGLAGNDFPSYAGLAVVVFAAWGFARRDDAAGTARLLAAAAIVAAIAALGTRLGGIYAWAYAHVPYASAFRVAIRALAITQLALVLLSARGLSYLIETAPGSLRRRATFAGAILVLAQLVAWAVHAGAFAAQMRAGLRPFTEATIADAARLATFDLEWRVVVLAAAIIVTALAAGRWARFAQAGVLALLVVDLGSVGVPFLSRATAPRSFIEKPPIPAIVRVATGDGLHRALDLTHERLYTNDWIRWRVRSLTGNHPAVPRGWDDLSKAGLMGSPGMLRAYSVGWLGGARVPDDASQYRLVDHELGGAPVYRLLGALPRAHAVPEVARLPDDRTAIAAIASPQLDPERTVVTTEDGIAGAYPGSATCRIRWEHDDPDALDLETEADSSAFLVIADTYLPGWTATLDGQAATIHRVHHVLRGIVLPAGRHQVALRYEPEGWRSGVLAARVAWLLWLAGAGLALAWGIRRPASPAPA